jgi:hypothetical protein
MTPEWKRRERHDSQVRAALAGDEIDRAGRIRIWHGARTIQKLEARGHSSLGYETCRCSQEAP